MCASQKSKSGTMAKEDCEGQFDSRSTWLKEVGNSGDRLKSW
jgi:hypothetical protein